jgi:hypothetical protein
VDEQTALQPRPRHAPTLPVPPQNLPHHYAHADKRAGALNRCAAFDTRSGQVDGPGDERKHPHACIALLEVRDRESDEPISTMHRVCDHVSTPHGRDVSTWLTKQPRFIVHFTPGHGSWMKHVEHWCRLLQRQRLRIADVESTDHLRAKREQFMHQWKQYAHPFNWSIKAVATIMAEAPALAGSLISNRYL